MGEKNSLVKSVIVLVLIVSICTLFLAGGNLVYSQVLEIRKRAFHMEVLAGFGEQVPEDMFDAAYERDVLHIKDKPNKAEYYTYKKGPRQAAVDYTGSGLWGPIQILLFLNLDSLTIKELRILAQSETPGLGARITQPEFLNRFKGLDYSEGLKIVTSRSGLPGEVDAITGATKTGDSLQIIINEAIALYDAVAGK